MSKCAMIMMAMMHSVISQNIEITFAFCCMWKWVVSCTNACNARARVHACFSIFYSVVLRTELILLIFKTAECWRSFQRSQPQSTPIRTTQWQCDAVCSRIPAWVSVPEPIPVHVLPAPSCKPVWQLPKSCSLLKTILTLEKSRELSASCARTPSCTFFAQPEGKIESILTLWCFHDLLLAFDLHLVIFWYLWLPKQMIERWLLMIILDDPVTSFILLHPSLFFDLSRWEANCSFYSLVDCYRFWPHVEFFTLFSFFSCDKYAESCIQGEVRLWTDPKELSWIAVFMHHFLYYSSRCSKFKLHW